MGTELKWTNIATVAAQKGYEKRLFVKSVDKFF